MKEKILFVDDDPNILEAYTRKLQHVLQVRTAEGPHAGLKFIQEKGPFAVVVADMNMPKMNGVEFLEHVRELAPDTVRMMLTGNANINVAMQAVNEGNVFRFLTKPCPSKLMGESIIAGIEQYRLVTAEKELLEGTLKGAVELLTEILSWVNPDAFGRTLQLRNTAMSIANKLNVENAWEIELAATLSQIGIMAIPQEILDKLAQGELLDEDEKEALVSVPSVGQELLKRIPRLENVAKNVLYQSKQYDGKGFPHDAIAGKDIPLGARILKVASDYHELRNSCATKQATLVKMKGREGWYDPAVLAVASDEGLTDEAQEDAFKVVQISMQELKVGYKLASDVMTLDDRKLVAAGAVITEALLVRLKKFAGVKGLKEPLDVQFHTASADLEGSGAKTG